ncbi:unnamed protein product [Cylicocyclus nassatus]|uniref:PLAT domain-containing protein n=1 Tax=Cylicocyclus nassatus TaxID=53992 RepID=A0AA36H3Z8_CYLNA|nr:unnamed protein product [Cylicocyclus nassatus]
MSIIFRTVLNFGLGQEAVVEGGKIIRNQTDGYVIRGGKVSGTAPNAIASVQSLLNQNTQKLITNILENSTKFLQEHGKELTPKQLNETSTSVLNVIGSLTQTIHTTFENPLTADLKKNLEEEDLNFDEIFNILPEDARDIRYVESYSDEEWAAEATKLVQTNLGKRMAAQMQSLMHTLEDAYANQAIENNNLPYRHSVSEGGNTIVISVGKASDLLRKKYYCGDWKVKFPPTTADLNTNLTDDDIFRIGIWCYDKNPYVYAENFDALITSGALEVHLKDLEGHIFPVENARKTINITKRDPALASPFSTTIYKPFESYQILDIHTFQTIAWNVSIFIEIRPTMVQDFDNKEAYVFLSYQRLPGPLSHDHSFMYHLDYIDKHSTNHIHVPANHLVNKTGLFYLGIGVVDTTGQNCVHFDPPSGISSEWCFVRDIRFEIAVKAMTKGCYRFENDTRFGNRFIEIGSYLGDTTIECETTHLSIFSVGLFNLDVDTDFKYQYIADHREQHIASTMIVIVMTVHMLIVMIFAINYELMEGDQGFLFNMADNVNCDLYHYIVAVETGYRMYAGTDSRIFITLYGTEADEMTRELSSPLFDKNSAVFTWGSTARFLLKTPWSLGDIRYVRVWVDNSGRGHRESWYCNRIFIKDLHTGSIYRFPIHDWLGQCMAEGASERLSAAETNPSMLNDCMSIHMLAETISYIAMYTGGGLRTRQRISRCSHGLSVLIAQLFLCLLNWAICSIEGYAGRSKFEQNAFGFTLSLRDVVFSAFLFIAILPFTSLLPYIKSRFASYDEHDEIEVMKRRDPNVKLPPCWPCGWRELFHLALTWIVIGFFITDVCLTSRMSEDASTAFTRRYFIGLVMWIVVTEPLKGMLCAYIILRKRPDHFISCDFDEAILPLGYGGSLPAPPECLKNNVVGTTESDLKQLKDNKDKKTREELFFETMRDMAFLLVSLVIIMGLVYYHRDRHGFYYQQQVRSLLNLDQIPYGPIAFESINQVDHFWKWSKESLAPALLAKWYDGQKAWAMRGFANDKVSRAMGIGHIRQIRTLPSKCNTAAQLARYFSNCSKDISFSTEDRTPQYARGWKPYVKKVDEEAPREYKYQTAEELQSTTVDGKIRSYDGGGYSVLLKGTPAQIVDALSTLQRDNWIDVNTRAIIVEISLYNAQVNYFAVVELVVEMPAEGYLLPSSWVESVRLIREQNVDGGMIVLFEYLYICFAVLSFLRYTYVYIGNMIKACASISSKWNPVKIFLFIFLGRFWDLLDFLVGILGICSVFAYFWREKHISKALDEFAASNGNAYINLSIQRNLELFFSYCVAGVVFFISCKMIKILRFNRRIAILADTLNYAGMSMIDFAVVFVIIFCAFNASLYLLLWDKFESYKSVVATFETTTAGMLGKFVVADMFKITMLASIIFMIFMYCSTLFLMNIFVMIILFEFEEVRNDSSRQTNTYDILDHIQTKILRSMGMFGRENMPACYVQDSMKDYEMLNTLQAKAELLLHRVRRWQIEDDDDFVVPPPRAQDVPDRLSFDIF